MAISGIITGLEKVMKALEKLEVNTDKAEIVALKEGALMVHNTAVKSIHEQGSGSWSVRYGPKRAVRVSDPGHPPNSDTGQLAQSIKTEFDEEAGIAGVGTNLKYGAALEFGTSKGLEARPWLSPAFADNVDAIRENFHRRIMDAIRRSAK